MRPLAEARLRSAAWIARRIACWSSKWASSQSVQPGELGFEPCFLHQPRIAGGDRFGHGELIDLRSGVFEAADAAIAGHGHIDEPRLALEQSASRWRRRCFGGVSVEFYLIILIALALNAAFALLDVRGSQGTSR